MKKTILIMKLMVIATLANADKLVNLPYVKKVDGLKITTDQVEATDSLYLNNKKVKTPDDFYTLSIVGKAIFKDYTTYVIWGGNGGSADNDYNQHYIFVTLSHDKQVKVSAKAPQAIDDKLVMKPNLIKVTYHNDIPYCDANDIGVYNYSPITNKITIIKPTKTRSYYQNKYANATPQQIIQQIKHDGCYLIEDDKLSFSHVCNFGRGYCQAFRWIKNPPHDQYYQLLNISCNEGVY